MAQFTNRLSADLAKAKQSLASAQSNQAKYADRHRRNHTFHVGDKVLLSAAHFRSEQPSQVATSTATKKFSPKYYGPFKVLQVVSEVALKLGLPIQWKCHPVVHVSHVQPYRESTAFPDRPAAAQPPPPVELEGEQYYEVEAIRKHRFLRGRLQYLVKFTGYDESENMWRPIAVLREMPKELLHQLIEDYRVQARLPGRAAAGHQHPPAG